MPFWGWAAGVAAALGLCLYDKRSQALCKRATARRAVLSESQTGFHYFFKIMESTTPLGGVFINKKETVLLRISITS